MAAITIKQKLIAGDSSLQAHFRDRFEVYLSWDAELLLDGATIAVKIPMGACHYPLACGAVVLHHTLRRKQCLSSLLQLTKPRTVLPLLMKQLWVCWNVAKEVM